MGGRVAAAAGLAALAWIVALFPATARGSAFCDCCCETALGNRPPCAGCDISGDGTVSIEELRLLGCTTNPTCATAFPVATATATPAATATPKPAACVGDCRGTGAVAINDLVLMVAAALDSSLVGRCAAGDANGDGAITIAELIAAVAHALNGCPPAEPTATGTMTETTTETATPLVETATANSTPTATDTSPASPSPSAAPTASATATSTVSVSASTATPSVTATRSPTLTATMTQAVTPTASTHVTTATATPSAGPACAGAAESAAGAAAIVANGMAVIPSVIAAIVSGTQFGAASSATIVERAAGACPRGGAAMRSGSLPAGVTYTLVNCALGLADGVLTLNGTASLSGLPTITLGADLDAVVSDVTGTLMQSTSHAQLSGTIKPTFGGTCYVTAAALQLNSGTLHSEAADGGSVTVTFTGTSVAASVAAFTTDCVPANYFLTFNGPATLAGSMGVAAVNASDASFAVSFQNLTVHQNATASPSETSIDGDLLTGCVGTLSLQTRAVLTAAAGAACPNGGTLRVSATQTADILYRPDGGVDIDTNLDGGAEESFASCLDARLVGCPAACMPTGSATVTGTATATAAAIATPTASATASATVTGTGTSAATHTPTPTASATAAASATNSRTATQTVPPFTATVMPSPTSTTIAAAAVYCDSLRGPALIPDNDPAGIDNSIVVPDNTVIADLNVKLDVNHSFVGDLTVMLRHVDTGTMVTLLDRPGVPAVMNGCGGDDISCTFDDLAGRLAQSECRSTPPAIDGSVKPKSPLGAFNGQVAAGTWRLHIVDNASEDVGSLFGWCMVVNSAAPVITAYTCKGAEDCSVTIGETFGQSFTFLDPNGDAVGWQIMGKRDDGDTFAAGEGSFAASGGGTVPLTFTPFTCPQGPCRTTAYDYFLVVTDQLGAQSPAARVHLVVAGDG
jgi:subtilisin-like proprotein convertase family protein